MLTFLVIISLICSLAALTLAGSRYWRDRSAEGGDVTADGQGDGRARNAARMESAVRQLASNQKKLAELAQASVRHVGVVRFDAFEDMGGRLSFSAALLDGRGDGVVITSINGRQDTRCYAKQVQNWTSIHNLSDEERQAIREALGKPDQRAGVEAH